MDLLSTITLRISPQTRTFPKKQAHAEARTALPAARAGSQISTCDQKELSRAAHALSFRLFHCLKKRAAQVSAERGQRAKAAYVPQRTRREVRGASHCVGPMQNRRR